MDGPLLSRENAPSEIDGPFSQVGVNLETEFHKLENLLQNGGTDKLVDAYFGCVSQSSNLFVSHNGHRG